MEEFFLQLNASKPPVKQEEPDRLQDLDDPLPAQPGSSADVHMADDTEGTGLAEMGKQVEEARQREADTATRLAEFMRREDGGAAKKRRGKQSSSDDDERREDESKAPLTTFGHSSRPRRSVNYANIERGDEAQAQSLVTEFGTGKKRSKRTRDELDENYEETMNKRKMPPMQRNRRPQNSNQMNSFIGGRQHFGRQDELEFAVCVPNVTEERPDPEKRTIGVSLDGLAAIKRSSGGFRKFVAWLSDPMILTMGRIVENRFILEKDTEDRKILKTIRHVYNTMPASYRLDWEHSARMDVFESRKFVEGLTMPFSEIMVKSDEETLPRPAGIAVRANCCSLQPILSDMHTTAEHFLSCHDTVHMFGCDFCHRLFSSRFDLTKHDCSDFTTHLLELTMQGKVLKMEACYMYLCCAQCGLWLSVKTNASGMKGWPYFATAIINHTCENLVPVIIYFRAALPAEGKNVRLSFQVMSDVDVGFPMKCLKCGTDEFKSVKEAEDHFKAKHTDYQCNKCPKTFGTKFLWKHHQHVHTAQSAQFAHYIMYCATFYPPPSSGKHPHIGFDTEIPVYGGIIAAELESLESCTKENEFVEPDAPTMRRKMLKWKPTRPQRQSSTESESSYSGNSRASSDTSSSSSSDSDFDRRKIKGVSVDSDDSDAVTSSKKKKKTKEIVVEVGPPGDLGYDHIDRNALFTRDVDEQEAIRKLEKLMDKHLFGIQDRLMGAQVVLDFMEKTDGVDPQEASMDPLSCSLADEIAEFTMKTVTMPIPNCVDPLKDCLLVNKIYNYCQKCKLVFVTDPGAHASICGVQDEETIVELYHAAAGPHSGLRCTFPDCTMRLCSSSALRNHCALTHGLHISLENLIPSSQEILQDPFLASRYDRSMMTISKYFNEFQHDERTFLAKMTDIDCYLPVFGQLERKHRQMASVLPIKQAPSQGISNNSSAALTRKYMPPTQQQRNTATVRPYKIPRASRWYHCQFCEKEYETHGAFVEHVSKQHVCPCTVCGMAYSSLTTKRTHVCSRKFNEARQKPLMVVTGECPECHDRFPVDIIYVHMLRKHFQCIEYIQATGEILPHALELKAELFSNQKRVSTLADPTTRTDYRLKLVKMGGPVVHGVSMDQLCKRTPEVVHYQYTPPEKKNIDSRLMCYLCEITFANLRELTSHLDEHPEQWKQCLFCNTTVADHFEMQKHLLQAHAYCVRGKMMCEYCHECLVQPFAASHFIYRCKKMPCCSICGMHNKTDSYTHLQRTHFNNLRRFQCGFCPSYFASMSEYYDHPCPGDLSRVFACSCAPDKYFSSVNGFCDHFDSIHIMDHTCLLCGLVAPSQEIIAKHRTSHLRTEAGEPQRKINIVTTWINPKRDSGYSRYKQGGPPPPSYQKVDRTSQHGYPMGGNSTVPIGVVPPTNRPLTIFDALEGPNRNGPSPPTYMSARFPIQPVRQAPKPAPPKALVAPASNDIIMLSDDDDDIVFEGAVMNGVAQKTDDSEAKTTKETNVTSSSNGQFNTQVRVEQTGTGYGGAQQPGYVDDDVEISSEPRKTPSEEPVLKEVDDENGDEELAVVAEVEHASGTLPSSINAGRKKDHKCPHCSCSFYTQNSLKHHVSGHRQDAGFLSTKETYGLPVDGKAWLCRNCCIAYENQSAFVKHMAVHGDTVHTCPLCSGIAFNQSTLGNHIAAHEAKTINYACGKCCMKFNTDLALMDHLFQEHKQALFYFCKICGLGNTNANYVFHHVLSHTNTKMMVYQRLGACPANLLNFQPIDEADLRMKVLTKVVELHTPSDCSHRSMLLSNETLVACKDCFCTQSWFNFLAHNGHLDENVVPHFQQSTIAPALRGLFPLLSHLNADNEAHMIKYGKMVQVNPRIVGQVALSTSVAQQSRLPDTIAARRAAQAPKISAPLVTTTPNGARVILPGQTPPEHRINRRVVMTRPPGTVAAANRTSPAGSSGSSNTTTDHSKCEECNNTIATEYDRKLHSMHTCEDPWFCRQCGIAQKSEIELFLHYMRIHLAPARQKFAISKTEFKSCVFKLSCPIVACNGVEFPNLKVFEKHIKANHTDLLPYEASCNAIFASQELCDRHEKTHTEYLETNGSDVQCCTLCGNLNMWSLPKDTNTDCPQSHIIRHGLSYRSACRICLKQFPADSQLTQVLDHISQDHGTTNGKKFKCNACTRVFHIGADCVEHCKTHVFHILIKSPHSQRGELVVSAEQEYMSHVGLHQKLVRPPVLPRSMQQHRQQLQAKRAVPPVVVTRPVIVTSSGSSTSASASASAATTNLAVSSANGGNAALQSIAAALSGIQSDETNNDDIETLD